jgi:predicted TIM-barrel fold metal-dependent hydrolase
MKRRHFLKSAASASFPALAASVDTEEPTRVVDTHTHFYDPTRPQGVPWPTQGTKLYRPVLPADWRALAEPHGIRQTVVVEASKWVEDNQWILDLAAQEKSIVGFVGHLDAADTAFDAHLRRFAANPLFRGVRWSGAALMKPELKSMVLMGAKSLADHGLELDVNGPPEALLAVADLALAVPDLRLVINHLGSSGDPQSLKPSWREGIRVVAKCPNVWMKVSALVEQVKGAEGAAPTDVNYYLPILDYLWQNFGADRLIYGSNWPVSDRGASYNTVFGLVRDYFSSKGKEACEKYFWQNSRDVYRWIER